MEEIINAAMKEQWDEDFLNTLNNYAMKINEHNLIDAIKRFGEEVYKEAQS